MDDDLFLYDKREELTKFKVVGLLPSIEFQKCRFVVGKLHQCFPTEFAEPEIRAMLNLDWDEYLTKMKRRHGKPYYLLRVPVAVYIDGTLLGDSQDLTNYISQKYVLQLNLDFSEIVNKELINYFTNIIEKYKRKFVYLTIAIDAHVVGSMLFMLYNDLVPITCENFLNRCTQAEEGYRGAQIQSQLIQGAEILNKIEKVPTYYQSPLHKIEIVRCGEFTLCPQPDEEYIRALNPPYETLFAEEVKPDEIDSVLSLTGFKSGRYSLRTDLKPYMPFTRYSRMFDIYIRDLAGKIKTLPHERRFIPVELTAKDMTNLEQYVESVINYTSKYNISFSISYAPENLVGKYVKYPSYGDFAETYILRSYGTWWKESEAYQQEYMPQEVDPLGAEDYITLGFESAVVPRDICIYETYNPGAVVRIWGRYSDLNWKLLWEGPPQICPEESRKFHPTIRKLNCLINEIRLEFNQSHLKYHTSIDAVLLGGYQPRHILQYNVLQNDLLSLTISQDADTGNSEEDENFNDACDFFSHLPHEVILHIFQYLDLKSLSRCAQVNRTWNEATRDPILYQNLSLKRYWHKINCETFDYFKSRCRGVKKIDLSWCGNHDKTFSNAFLQFLDKCCQQLTHLSLCHCHFVNNEIIAKLPTCRDLTELRLRNAKADFFGFQHLSKLNRLVTLDLCSTSITDEPLMAVLKANPNLRHLILDFCESLERLDQVVETVSNFNRNLTTWSSFKTTSLTSLGALHFAKCANLKELDLGWCFVFTHPGDSLEKIALTCRSLKRLIISQWRGVNDQMLLPVVMYCKNLTQLDLLGIKSITGDICERALMSLPNLRLLDISFCDSIVSEQ
ncbi:F-box/LRR-repeat protein 4, partial [Asbolus verrucosus]